MISQQIKEKRFELGLTQKEFSDALNMGRYGDRTLRRWENEESKPSVLELSKLLEFASTIPFPNPSRSKFTFIDLFAGIGGIRIPFTELKGKCVFSSEWDKFADRKSVV